MNLLHLLEMSVSDKPQLGIQPSLKGYCIDVGLRRSVALCHGTDIQRFYCMTTRSRFLKRPESFGKESPLASRFSSHRPLLHVAEQSLICCKVLSATSVGSGLDGMSGSFFLGPTLCSQRRPDTKEASNPHSVAEVIFGFLASMSV